MGLGLGVWGDGGLSLDDGKESGLKRQETYAQTGVARKSVPGFLGLVLLLPVLASPVNKK